jgi:hypothetical protein
MAEPDDQAQGSVAEDHDWMSSTQRPVSPTTDSAWRGGTLRPTLKPVACWRIHHAYFRFDSSFILPEIAPELARLKPLIRDDRVATIFGHADQVGSDEYNSHLAARRARSLFGLLTRNADIWLDLYSPQDYDTWGLASTQTALAALTAQDGNPYYAGPLNGVDDTATDKAIRKFQGEQGLAVDGDAGPLTRKQLYELYMDLLTGSPGQPLMRPDQFLGDPADNANPKGKAKAALQGCGEFNPVLIFSKDDEKAYAKNPDKTARNAANAPNRRDMIFFFAKNQLGGMTPSAVKAVWPCPTWDTGGAECRKHFWPDYKQRLANGDTERHYEAGERTMACKWYDHFARLSPCEGKPLEDSLIISWDKDYEADVPPDLVLELSSGGAVLGSIRWVDAPVRDDRREFAYAPVTETQTTTLTAVHGDERTVLWEDQVVGKGPSAISWKFTLADLFPAAESVDDPSDGSEIANDWHSQGDDDEVLA